MPEIRLACNSNPGDAAGREAGGESTTNAGRTFNLKLRLMPVQRMLGDGQPQPGAASVA